MAYKVAYGSRFMRQTTLMRTLARGKDLKNARSFRGDIRPVNRDKTDIICSGFQTQAAEFIGG